MVRVSLGKLVVKVIHSNRSWYPIIEPKVKTIDGRFAGGKKYKYCVEFFGKTKQDDFCNAREWCWETWGASSELVFIERTNENWAWISDNYRTRIYLKTEVELNWYKLRWQ